MEQYNRFSSGVISDINYSDVKQSQMVFPTLNVRIFNKDGQGFIASNLPGNEYEFSIKSGYVIIGAIEHNGVLYIVSHNKDIGLGEIGCFPSPRQYTVNLQQLGDIIIDPSKTGFERVYKPLPNFLLSTTRKQLTTTDFKFDLSHQVDLVAKESYDGSVDLYLADYKNPNIVINTGFDQNGIVNDRLITSEMFDGALHLITNSSTIMNIELDRIDSNGKLAPGNYFIYGRYVTEDFNRTSFITQLGPIQIGIGEDTRSIEGLQEKNWFTGESQYSNKKIVINVSNLDTSFSYFELGVVRYSSLEENQIALSTMYVIDRLFNTTDTQVEITGYEGQLDLTNDELLQTNIKYNICKSQEILNKRYYGINWKSNINLSSDVDNALKEFALKIWPNPRYETLQDVNPPQDPYWSNNKYQYKNSEDITNKLGYFREQIYPFAVVFKFSNGTFSYGYPIKGLDLRDGGYNDKGLVKMPEHITSKIDNALLLDFNIGDAIVYATNNSNFNDIVGFYIVRADRIENLVTQGLLLRTINKDTNGYFDGENGDSISDAKSIPSMWKYSPWCGYKTSTSEYTYSSSYAGFQLKRLAVLSVDNLFENISINNGAEYSIDFIQKISEWKIDIVSNHSPNEYTYYQKTDKTYTTSKPTETAILTKVPQGVTSGVNRFVSALKDGKTNNDGIGFEFEDTSNNMIWYNRSMFTPSYLGVDFESDITSSEMPYGTNFLVNIYKEKNDKNFFNSVVNGFSVQSTNYSILSDIIPINTSITVYNLKGGGDCYLQRTYIRQMRQFDLDDNAPDYISTGGYMYYHHGYVIGFISENKVNTAMRNNVMFRNQDNSIEQYTYWPKVLDTPISTSWIWSTSNENQIEAFQINKGYNVSTSIATIYGRDFNIDLQSNFKKNRIYHSLPAISGSYIDQFRDIGINSYQDFLIDGEEIIDIVEASGHLIAISNNSIFQIYISENNLAKGGKLIGDDYLKLANIGSQHKWSIIKSPLYVYGVDVDLAKIWRIRREVSKNTGGRYFIVEDLGVTKGIDSYIRELLSSYSEYTDIINELDDTPVLGNGVVSGINRDYKEIYFTFLFSDGTKRKDTTIVFDERRDVFAGTFSFVPPTYMNIKNNLYTVKPVINGTDYSVSNDIYKHDFGDYQVVYDNNDGFELSFIINGNTEKNNTALLLKFFESLHIEMNSTELTDIMYKTDQQGGIYNFKTTDFMDKPEYEDTFWNVPVTVQTITDGTEYEDGSEMTGTWLKVTLRYYPQNRTEELLIKKALTRFDIIMP